MVLSAIDLLIPNSRFLPMTRVLVSAFEPYDIWRSNASWLTLVELTRELPSQPQVTTRLYPVNYEVMQERLQQDLASGFDYVLMLGQAAGRPRVEIETVALNMCAANPRQSEGCKPLVEGGPAAYTSSLPAELYCQQMREAGIPAAVSHHAGAYLCNAALYFALHSIQTIGMDTKAIFIHVPLDASQAAAHPEPIASMPATLSAKAIRIILDSFPLK
jgi:pyroglutamyl-peptidase